MKETTWQVLSKHLPPTIDSYEPTACALAPLTPWHQDVAIIAQVHLRNFQSEGCILAPFLPVCNLIPHLLSRLWSPWLSCHSLAILFSQRVQMSSLHAGRHAGCLWRHCLAIPLVLQALQSFRPSWRFCKVGIPPFPDHSMQLSLSSRKDR